MYAAYFERLTDNNQALLLVEELQKQFHVDTSALPVGSKVGMWFSVGVEDDQLVSILLDEDKTQTMKQEIDDRMQRLQSKKTSRFKRN
ncbi:DUF3006 domain-containing protein [Filibacter tadaridae]|uniref:DUF3006 domain-containing protein n=1 Tax=Filibacter tadaridae TaxID=2483811 RepID=A0A3P5XHP0_9BACL|nr:DUF3006 family protein [Filibacter tadaridae]VDC28228.1 hypothetical protein FILTAD_01842 [Filibacter tadaridae]